MFGNKLKKIEKLTAKKQVSPLVALTGDKSEEVRLAAIRALGAIDDDASFNALVPLVHASDASARKAAAEALAALGRPAGRVHIEHQMRVEKDSQVLSAMQTALGRIKEKY